MIDTPLRLRRVVHPETGHALLLSFTTGLSLGVVPGMEDLPGAIAGLARTRRMTAAVVHAGVLKSVFAAAPGLPCGVVVDLFGGTLVTPRPDRRELICTLEHAVRVGADAVLATVSHGGPDEAHRLRLCGEITRQARDWGVPLILRVLTSETDASRVFSPTLCGSGARMAYELGADMVIVNYPGSKDAFAEVLEGIDIPVLVGGAPHMATDEALLRSVADAVGAGARGVAFSATMFWDNGPADTLTKLDETVRRTANPRAV